MIQTFLLKLVIVYFRHYRQIPLQFLESQISNFVSKIQLVYLIQTYFLNLFMLSAFMKPTVLIIDDDQETAEIMSDLLSLRSIEVLALGYDGKKAVELYQKHSPDVVMMDYWMPEFDGLYGLKGIRDIDSEAKVIIITGSADHECSEELFESKPSAIIQKPFDTNKLVALIDKISLGDTVKVNAKTKKS